MWPEDDDIDAALRGEYAAGPADDVNWARITAGAIILAVVTIFAIGAVILAS